MKEILQDVGLNPFIKTPKTGYTIFEEYGATYEYNSIEYNSMGYKIVNIPVLNTLGYYVDNNNIFIIHINDNRLKYIL